MEFGKPKNPELVDWRLREDTELTKYALEELNRKADATQLSLKPKVYIGSTSWGDKAYLGEVYPEKTKAKDFLEAYGKQFNTIELNTTFYRMPTATQTEAWAAKTPQDFRFCPKVNKLISQSKKLGVGTSRVMEFCDGIRGFGDKLGPSFIQLPLHFDTSKFSELLEFLDLWPKDMKLAIELRHASWFSESKGADLFAELYARSIGTTVSDVGLRRDVAHMNITTKFFLLRWVGILHDTDHERLNDWAHRLSSWLSNGLEEAFVFTHQAVADEAAKSAIEFEKAIRQLYPSPLESRSPILIKKVGPSSSQTELFG